MAVPEHSSGFKNGWRLFVTAGFGVICGFVIIAVTEGLAGAKLIPPELRDFGLVIGGALTGLVALYLDEFFRVAPERAQLRFERDAEIARHQEERRIDFEQYRDVQNELRQARAAIASLESKQELSGALDRDRVGDALLLGFYFHRRGEGLPSSPKRSVFTTAATRLKLLTDTVKEVRLDKNALHDVLEIAYGSVVAEGFDLGYLLSHLRENGFVEPQQADVLAELENQLKGLKFNSQSADGNAIGLNGSGLFKRLAERISAIVRRA